MGLFNLTQAGWGGPLAGRINIDGYYHSGASMHYTLYLQVLTLVYMHMCARFLCGNLVSTYVRILLQAWAETMQAWEIQIALCSYSF